MNISANNTLEIFLKTFGNYFDHFSIKCKTINLKLNKHKPSLTKRLLISGQKLKDLYALTQIGDDNAFIL